MRLIRGNEVQQQQWQTPPQQPVSTMELIKRRGLKLAKWLAGIWFLGVILMELANILILGDHISLTGILYSFAYTLMTWLAYMMVVVVGSFFIKD